eukprot:c21759_g3_i1 orf=539-889(+)
MATPASGPAPYGPLLLLCLVIFGAAVPWYLSFEPMMEDFDQQLRIALMLLPLGLLLAVKWLSSPEGPRFRLPKAEPDSIHRAGGSPWGIAMLLVVVLVMISYQSSLLESWNPLLRA